MGAGALVLVLLLFAIRGCLDARKERAYENYLRDLSALVTNSNQLSSDFFARLSDPGETSRIEFQEQIASVGNTGDQLLQRAQGLDHPDEVAGAQADLELAFELRRDGLNTIVEQMPTALGNEGRAAAIDQIISGMRQLLASDVLYSRAQAGIEEVLAEEGLSGEVPESVFLKTTEPWLDTVQLTAVLSQVAGNTGAAGDALRGTELSSTVLRPGNVPLTPDTTNTISQVPGEIEIAVLNGGEVAERDVAVSFELLGSTEPISGQGTIPRIPPATTRPAVLTLDGEIPTGEQLTLSVTVLPVPGEDIVDNNEAIYQLQVE